MKQFFWKIIKSGKFAPLLSGLLMILAFPPLPVGFLAWIALLPLIASFYYDDFHFGFEKGFFYGLVLNLGVLYWLSVNQGTQWYYSTLSMIASVLFLAVFYGLAGTVISIIGKRNPQYGIMAFPFVFTALEWVRSLGVLGFTWNNLCYTQSHYESIIQIVSFVGPFGLSLWVYLLNSLVFLLFTESKDSVFRYKSILAMVFVLPLIFGFLILQSAAPVENQKNPHTLSVSVVQPNIDPNEKWQIDTYRGNMDRLFELSEREIQDHGSDIVVWPETAVPTYIRLNRRNSRKEISAFLKEHSAHLITGVPDYEYQDKEYFYYNSVFFMNPDNNNFDVYSKMHLVPFGEYIPLSHRFESLKKLNLGQGNFIAGKKISLFDLPKNEFSVKISAAVCFESSFPDLIRKGVQKGSQLLAIVTNDAWFGNTSAPYLHAEIARFRAVENHIPVVRAANTGVSMIIDKYGRVVKKSKFNEIKAFTAKVDVKKENTFYSRTGNWIGLLCVIAMSFFIILSFFGRNNEN